MKTLIAILLLIPIMANAQYAKHNDRAGSSIIIAVAGFAANEAIIKSNMTIEAKNKATLTVYASTLSVVIINSWIIPELKKTKKYKKIKRKLKIRR